MERRPPAPKIGEASEATERLEMSYEWQKYFTGEIINTTTAIEEKSPIGPSIVKKNFGGIRLRTLSGDEQRLNLDYSYDKAGRRSATLSFRAQPQFELGSMRLDLSSDGNWEIWHPSNKESVGEMDNAELLHILEHRFINTKAYIADVDSLPCASGMEIVALFEKHFGNTAKTKREEKLYTADDYTIGDDFITDSTIRLLKTKTKQFDRYSLSINAPYAIGTESSALIKKAYVYTVETNRTGISQAGGEVKLSSKDGVAQEKLALFAQQDAQEPKALEALSHGLTKLHDQHLEQQAA